MGSSDLQNCLAFPRNRSDSCRDRGNHRKGETQMITIAEDTGTAQATTSASEPKATKKARVGARRAPVPPAKAKSGKKATPAKKAPKGANKAGPAPTRSKPANTLEPLNRPAVPT